MRRMGRIQLGTAKGAHGHWSTLLQYIIEKFFRSYNSLPNGDSYVRKRNRVKGQGFRF